jgi:hypothetical protein
MQRHAGRFFQIAAQMHRQMRDGAEGAQKSLLPDRLLRVVGPGDDVSRKVADAVDLIARRRKGRSAKSGYVQPLLGGALQATVIKVETVNIDVSSYLNPI